MSRKFTRILGATSVFLMAISSFASAETSGEALKTFGFLGTWSPACETESMREVYGIAISVPFFGAPTWSEKSGKIKTDIKSASRVTADKIKILVGAWEYLFVKTGEKIQLLSQRSIDGNVIRVKDGYYDGGPDKNNPTWKSAPTPILERCLN